MMKNLLLIILFFTGNLIYSQSCSVNAGGNATICGTTYSLQGSVGSNSVGNPTWTLLSKPSGAPDPTISSPNILTPNVTGMTSPGNYVFQISQSCTTGTSTSQVTITAPGDVATFTAGPDITNVNATVGTVNLNGVVPAGYTAQWSAYNIYRYERAGGDKVNVNSTFGSPTSAVTSFSLTKKADHNEDPAYVVTLRITAINNPNCWYEDTAVIRFIPNPQIIVPNVSTCLRSTDNRSIGLSSTSPIFNTTTNGSAGNPTYGTTVTMNVNSQPAGGNISFWRIFDGSVYFNGITVPGIYKFTLTVTNSSGTYTTPEITYTFSGLTPNPVSFLVSSDPEQMMIYSTANSGGEVQCGMAGSTTPITYRFTLNAADPVTNTSIVTATTVYPPGGTPTFVTAGDGTATRSVTVTPPAGGWRVGTYRFDVKTSNGSCISSAQAYYIHISDGNRANVSVNNMAVCYPGSGVVTATVPLPAIYKGVVNSSYFQDFSGQYDFTLVSKPSGSGTPTYETSNLRLLTSTSTVIGNLTTPGEYVFKIKANGYNSDVGAFLDQEYACSGTSREGTFTITVSPQINANAGSDQNIVTSISTATTLNGNNPGIATGTWTLVSKPTGATDPVIVTPSAYNSSVTGLTTAGAYTFRWTIATGTCTSSDDVIVSVMTSSPGGVSNGLSYWYRADKNATNTGAGTDVTAWTDMWNGTIVKQLGTNALPKYTVGTSTYFNFNPGINFTAIAQTLGNNTVQTLTSLNYDVFTVTKEGMTGTGTNPRLFSIGMNNTTTGITNWDAFGISATSNVLERRVYGAGSQLPAVNPTYNIAIPSIMYFRNTNTSTIKGLNGSALGTSVTYAAQGAQLGGHIFGSSLFSANGSDNTGFVGNVGETIVYGAGTLSDADRRKVDSYLAIKYGVTLGQVATAHYLDTAGGIVWNGTTNTAYNNNIFGVSRDDIEVFEQKVSKSVNAGTILTVATINDFVNPNQAAARTGFANDKTYLLLGDNNNTNVALNSITVNGFTGGSRIQRQWLAQPNNAVGTVNFGVDLTSYGAGFESSASVKMIVADDASFTTNVVYVSGTYDNISGKWVHPYVFASGQNKYITYVTVDETSCTTGCNGNTYLNAADPNTIEYDNLIASSDAIVAKEKDGTYKIWGYGTGPIGITGNANKLTDLLVPTAITPANGFNYTGTLLKVSIAGGSAINAALLLTTDGLYGWGYRMTSYTKTTNNADPQFGKITINGKTDGLPPGISPANVKALYQSYSSIVITTCKGEAWTMSGYSSSAGNTWLYGDGSPNTSTSSSFWHRVKTSATETLDNVVVVRGHSLAKIALTSNGKLYTWGANTFIGDGTDPFNGTNRSFATEVTVPNGITPKMIGMTEDGSAANSAYFLLATNGKLFAMGSNNLTMLGDSTFSATFSPVWREVTATSGGNTLGGNIAWISPTEEGYTTSPSINVLTNDNKQWGWGSNQDNRLGQSTNPSSGFAPIYMPGNTTNTNGMGLSDEIIAVETGGRFTINYKKSSQYFGFVGATSYGTIGNGSTGNASFPKYTYNTAIVDVCGVSLFAACYKPGAAGVALDTKVGITSLNRAGANDADNWPMVRKGGWIALESKTKGFVPNRIKFNASNQPVADDGTTLIITTPVEGMMVFDVTNKCMKIYTTNGVSMGWYCITTQTCPDGLSN